MADIDYTAEEWRVISAFTNYEISNFGRVRRVASGPGARVGHILKQSRGSGQYFQVNLFRERRGKSMRVHVLVAEIFHGPRPSAQHHAAHSDGDAANNRAGNIRWATCTENCRDKVIHGTANRGERNGRTKLTDDQAIAIYADRSTGDAQLAREYGVSPNVIHSLRSGRTWRHVTGATKHELFRSESPNP